ncbi:uncharacterized protein LOC128213472 isoform X2 [Mya arenaria]|uniref:uncharacterized protein LOC128213472 isoform X2 n=1 Tax=Mya arenaria TaxID=6604 RepID=UPI0022E54EE0|nr:uncharacterized protein LOC128213472 isoform X2 [Mya arenaria]
MMKLCLSLQNIVFALLAILMFHMVRTQGDFYYRIVGDQCIRTCAHLRDIPNVTFNCDGDNSTCDWQCAAQRMGCAEGLIYHCAQDFKNLELKLNKTEYIQACAPERFCNAGEEPSVTFSFDDVVQSPRNAKINCVACTDPNFYNKQDGQSSASYSRCYLQKFNKCIPEYHKINCDDISWLERKQTDGYCRCDARNGYAPENENVKTMCFYSDELCAPKTCPIPSQELLLNYTCGDRCPSGMHRTEKSDECVPNKPVQTTRSTPLTLSSQPRSVQTETNAGISTTKETVKVLSTKGREENGGSDGSNKDTIILVSVLISLAVTALLVLLIAIRLRRESQQNTPEEKRKSLVKKIAGSYIKMKVINSTVHFDSAHPNTTKEPHETSFINGIDRPTSAAINDQDTDDTEDKPFLQGPLMCRVYFYGRKKVLLQKVPTPRPQHPFRRTPIQQKNNKKQALSMGLTDLHQPQ